jgi:hypothetical protein
LERDGCADWENEDTCRRRASLPRAIYLGKLKGMPHFVRLETRSEILENSYTFRPPRVDILCAGMHEAGKCCTERLEKTANALNDNIVSVMVLAVREQLEKGNLELNMTVAVAKSVFSYRMVGKCVQFTMGLAQNV